MARDSMRFVGVLTLGLAMAACSAASQEERELANELTELGFTEIPELTLDGPEDRSAEFYYNDDGRTALLVSEADGAEWNGFLFAAGGELQSTLEQDAEAAYCPNCLAGWAACIGSCYAGCWSDWEYLTGSCYADCRSACNYYYNICASALGAITGGCYL